MSPAVTTSAAWPPALAPPPALTASPLSRRGGFAQFQGLPTADRLLRLRREAFASHGAAQLNRALDPDGEEWRGGCPERRFRSAAGGEEQDRFYHSPELRDLIARQVGLPVAPSGERGSYSYYSRAGDSLGLHRDVEACDLAVITCLFHGPATSAAGGALALYPGRCHEPLSAIRSTAGEGMARLRLQPGQTVLLLGGLVPHEVLPVGPREVRIVSVLCFRVLTG